MEECSFAPKITPINRYKKSKEVIPLEDRINIAPKSE